MLEEGILLGLKGFVAEFVVKAFGEFLDFDSDEIEIKLLGSPYIIARQVPLREIRVNLGDEYYCTVNGEIEEIRLSWKWGRDSEHRFPWANSVILEVLRPNLVAELHSGQTKERLPDLSANEKQENHIQRHISKQGDKVINTMLEIVAVDVDLRIVMSHIEEEPQTLLVGIPKFHITHTNPQCKTLSLESICAHFLVEAGTQIHAYTVLSPSDHTIHLHGDTYEKITEVEGTAHGEGITFHLGLVQLTFLNDLVGILLQVALTKSDESLTNTQSIQVEKGEQISDDLIMVNYSSKFNFRMAYGKGVANFCFLDVVMTLAHDGSIMLMEGRGIVLNDHIIASFSDHGSWCANIVAGYVGLQNEGDSKDLLAYIGLSDSEVMILLKCVGDLCQYYDDLKIAGATAIMEKIFAELEYCWIVDFEDLIQLNIGGQLPVEMTICGFRLKFGDIVTLLVNTIDRMVIPGKFKLNKPIEYAALVYNHDSLRVILDFVELIQLESSDDEESIERRMTNDKIFPFMSNYEPQGDDFFESAALDQPDDFCLSYPIDIALSKLRVLTPDGLLTSFTMKDMQLGINPVSSENGIVSMELALQEVKHEMIKLEEVSVSAVVSVVDLETISQVNFEADRISIATGYSTKSWLGLIGWRFGKQKKAKRSWKPVALPFVHVQRLKIVATVDGVVGMKETSIFMKKFDGKEDTTTEDLIRFYSSSIVAKVPGIVTSTEVLGVDVADTVVGQYGTVYATHLLGSAGGLAGGVFCVAAYDGIRNAIVAGKKSRGVNSDDQWQLTDFGRGLRIVAKTAAKAGAEKRGKEGSDGNIVDWSYGMADDMGQYTSNNKSRLGAAGAATFGYAIGGLLAGPVGGVAGGIIASAVTGKTIDGYLKKIEDKEKWEKLKEGCSLYEGTMEDVNGEKIKRIIGILTRRRRYFKREWRPHLFILQSNELRYYETTGTAPSTDEQDAKEFNFDEDEAPRKRLCLAGAEVSIDDSRSVPNAGIFAFTIRGTANRMTWVLGAPTESDRDLWVARLTLVSQRQKNFVEGLYFGSQR